MMVVRVEIFVIAVVVVLVVMAYGIGRVPLVGRELLGASCLFLVRLVY